MQHCRPCCIKCSNCGKRISAHAIGQHIKKCIKNTKEKEVLKINRYRDLKEISSEARKDYIDRHSPFVLCDKIARKGEMFEVMVRVGKEYEHPDDFDHYVSSIRLYNRETKLAESTFFAGALGHHAGQQTVTFYVVLDKIAVLTAQSYCTKHGIWESEPIKVEVA